MFCDRFATRTREIENKPVVNERGENEVKTADRSIGVPG
jgi:hypothetical protein